MLSDWSKHFSPELNEEKKENKPFLFQAIMANAAKTNGSTVMRVPTVHDPVADAAKPKSTRER